MPFITPEEVQDTQSSVFPADFSAPQPDVNPEYYKQKAVTTGLATAPATDPQGLADHIDNTQNKLELGYENQINTNIAYDQKSKDKTIQQDAIKDSIVNNDPITFNALANSYANPVAPTPAEIKAAPTVGAVNNLSNFAAHDNAVQAKVQEQLSPEALADANDLVIKNKMIADELTKANKDYSDESIYQNLDDWAGLMLLPLRTEHATTGNFPTDSKLPKILTGSHIQDERNALMTMPLKDFIETGFPTFLANAKKNESYISQNPLARRMVLENLLDYNDKKAGLDNALSIFDHATLGLGAGQVFRSLSRMMVTTGSRVGSAELNASKMLFGGSGSTIDGTATVVPRNSPLTKFIIQDDAFTDASHSGFTPNFELTGTNAPTAVNHAIDRQEALAQRINYLQRSPFLNPKEQATAIDRAVKDIGERITPQGLAIADTHMVSQPNSATTQVGVKIGKADGTGWSTEANARAAMERSGYGPDDFQYNKGLDGQHYPTLKTTVSGNGLVAPADIAKLSGGTIGAWRKYVQNTDITDLPELRQLKNQGAYNQAYLESKVYAPLLRPASELGGKSQNVLAKVINNNMDLGRDLNIVDFTSEWKRVSGKNPSNKEITAYYSLRQASHVNYALDNRTTYEDFAHNGFKDYEFNTPAANLEDFPDRVRARRVESLPLKNSTRIYDASKLELNAIDSLRQTDIAALKEEGYHLFEVQNELNMGKGPVTHILAKTNDYIQHELSPFQIGYKEGTVGPRIYQKGYFAKQVRTHTFEDGTKYRGRDLTLFHARTRKELEDYTGKFNQALDAFSKYNADKMSVEDAEKIIGENTDFETVQDFQKAIDDGMFTEHPMQVVRDGERPRFGSPNAVTQELHGNPEGLSDFTIHAYQQGKLVHSPRGSRLTDPKGQLAPVLDVYSSVSRAATTAIRHAAYDGYKKKAIDKWYATANKLQVLKEPNNGAAFNLFDKDPYTRDITPDVLSKLETMRMSILRTIGQKTMSQRAYSAAVEHIGNFIEGKEPLFNTNGKLYNSPIAFSGNAIAPRLYDIMDANPLAALRGFTFHKTLGMFNPAQLIMQPSTMAMALSAHPIYGIKAAQSLPLVRLATINGSDTVLDYLSKLKAVHGMKPAEFKLYIKELKNSGIADNSTALAIRDQGIDTAISQSKANLGVKDIAEASSFFFNEGNKINQLVAHGIAYRKALKELGITTTPQARAFIADETSKLAISMKSTSAAYWQKGLLSWPTQFLGYTERMLETVAPAFLGGDARFTAAQKTRIFAGQALLFGKYGVPAAGLAEGISYAFGIDEDKAKQWEGGVMDKAASDIFGTDVSYSQRVGIAENVRQLIDNLSQGNFAEVMGGATYTGSSNFIKQLRSVVNLTMDDSLNNEQIDSWDRMSAVMSAAQKVFSNNISSFSNFEKAKSLYNYGKFITNTGKTVVTKPELIGNHMSALAVMLSIPLSDVVKANDLYQTNAALQESENTLVSHIAQFRQDYVNASAKGDFEAAQEASDQVQIMLMILPDNAQQKANIVKRVWRRVAKDDLKVLEKQNRKLDNTPYVNTDNLTDEQGE